MGSWGSDSFDNDTALDWVIDLCRADDLGPIVAALHPVIEAIKNEAYVDMDDSFEAVAAAEVVAALCGRASQTLPDEVSAWVQAHPVAVDEPLVQMALQAVMRVATDSELQEESDDEWQAIMADLRARLEQCLTSTTSR